MMNTSNIVKNMTNTKYSEQGYEIMNTSCNYEGIHVLVDVNKLIMFHMQRTYGLCPQ